MIANCFSCENYSNGKCDKEKIPHDILITKTSYCTSWKGQDKLEPQPRHTNEQLDKIIDLVRKA